MGTRTRAKSSPVVLENIVDTGTEGTKVAVGTTAQRGSTAGQWRFNTTTGYFEGYNNAGAFSTLEPDPTVTASDTDLVNNEDGGNATIVITGTNFSSGGTISFMGNAGANFDAASTTLDSATQVTAVAPKSSFLNAQEPYKIKFTSSGGKVGTSATGLINVNMKPTWTTSSGSIATVVESAALSGVAIAATDPDSDSIAYTETGGTNLATNSLTLNSSTGAITGNAPAVGGDTTISFTGRATAGGQTSDRAFSILVKDVTTSALLWDATNLSGNNASNPTSNGLGLNGLSPNTAVTLSNVYGASGTMANGYFLADKSNTWGHYTHDDGVDHSIASTFWSVGMDDNHNSPGRWFGTHDGGSAPNTDLWFSMDFGANPSFSITRLAGMATWRGGTGNFILYGTNDISAKNGIATGASDAGSLTTTNLTEIFNMSNPATNWDSGTVSSDYYRYYVWRILITGSSYDWGWDMCKIYGDYY